MNLSLKGESPFASQQKELSINLDDSFFLFSLKKKVRTMYQLYKCRCRKEFILITECIEDNKGYLVCPYCSSRRITKEGKYNSLKECMNHSVYKRVNGSLKQIK